jgi:solute carrier family 25 carnitine/acylcarnitine transporter 20/29
VVVETLKHEGIRGFYKGMGPPFFSVPVVNSIIFASYEFSKRMMHVQSESDFTFNQSLVAGCFAGFVNSVVVGPMELVKCRLQLQIESAEKAYYKGPWDCVRKMFVEEGPKSLSNGMVSTILREIPAYGC